MRIRVNTRAVNNVNETVITVMEIQNKPNTEIHKALKIDMIRK